MGAPKKQTGAGPIAVVQEDRIWLMTDNGRGFLLTLAYNVPLLPNDLRRLHQTKE